MADTEAIVREALGTWLQCVSVSFDDPGDMDAEIVEYADQQFGPEDVDASSTARFAEWGAGLAAIAGDHGVVVADRDLGDHLGMWAGGVGDPLCYTMPEKYPDAPPQTFEKMDEYLESNVPRELSAGAYRANNGDLKITAE